MRTQSGVLPNLLKSGIPRLGALQDEQALGKELQFVSVGELKGATFKMRQGRISWKSFSDGQPLKPTVT